MKALKLITLFITGICLSSCLEILEDIKINDDGSGSYKLILNLSKSKGQINKIMSQDSIQGKPVPTTATISSAINETIDQLNQQDGISEVTKKLDFENYIFNLNFNFKDIDNLNQAVNNIIRSKNPKAPLNPITYSFSNKQFTRTLNSDLVKQANDGKQKVGAFLTDFESAKITSITRFESEIDHSDHSTAKISSNGKNCFEQSKIDNILTDNKLHTHKITLK